MRCNIVITPDGQISAITQEGTFEDGGKAINDLFAAMKANGIKVELTKPIEQHRHDDEPGVKAHSHVHSH